MNNLTRRYEIKVRNEVYYSYAMPAVEMIDEDHFGGYSMFFIITVDKKEIWFSGDFTMTYKDVLVIEEL